MTDTTDEDKEIERIARIAMMNSLLARARHAEAERERMKDERDRMEDALRDIMSRFDLEDCELTQGERTARDIARAALWETGSD
jgi:hypothetical protein